MPNWCMNELTISGDKKDLERFKNKSKVKTISQYEDITELSLQKTVPRPRSQDENWYNWNIDNWGTKWDVQAEIVDEWDDTIVYSFDSAWSPPVIWLESVSNKYPKLYFRLKYEEPGVGFLGVAKAEKGEIDDTCIDL